MRRGRALPALFLTLLIAACDRGARATLAVRGAWARAADSGAVTAAYFTVVNGEAGSVTLLAVSSPRAASVTLHETMQMNGMVHMMSLEAPQIIAAGDSLVLREGGTHLMLNGLTRALAVGDSLPLVLTFAEGRTLQVAASVRAP